MEETYERLRAELATAQDMLKRTVNPASRERLKARVKELKGEAHQLLLAIQAEKATRKAEAAAKLNAEEKLMRAAFNASIKCVVSDFLPKRLSAWVQKEADRRKSGATARKAGKFTWLRVLLGVHR